MLWREVRSRLAAAWAGVVAALAAVWSFLRPPLLLLLQLVAALVVLFEEWGWRPLVELLGRLSRFRPIAALELWIAGLPPYGALLAFALPTTLLFPLKIVAMWLLAQGQVLAAGALFLGAKIASTALIARIFMLVKPALMQIAWFARAYEWFVPWKEHYFALIRASWAWRYGRMVKNRVRLEAKKAWARVRPRIVAMRDDVHAWLAAAPWREWAASARVAWRTARARMVVEAQRIRHAIAQAWARSRNSRTP